GAIVHELGDRAGADRADVARLVADRVEHLFVAVEDLLVAADPEGETPGGGAPRPTANRRIEHIDAFFAKAAVELAHQRRRVGREVEPGAAFRHPGKKAVGSEPDRLDLGPTGER